MKNAFEKYFLSLVFILISGFALLHANSFFTDNYNFHDSQELSISSHSGNQFKIISSSSSNSDYEKSFIELSENEELELLDKNTNQDPLFPSGIILTAFFYVFVWESLFRRILFPSGTLDAIRTVLCKRYIQFEVFRI